MCTLPRSWSPASGAGVELVLLLFALVLALGAYAQVDLNVAGELSARFPYLAGRRRCSRVLAAHLAVRWRLPYADPVILPCVVLLERSRPRDDPPDRPDQHTHRQTAPVSS